MDLPLTPATNYGMVFPLSESIVLFPLNLKCILPSVSFSSPPQPIQAICLTLMLVFSNQALIWQGYFTSSILLDTKKKKKKYSCDSCLHEKY